MIWDFIRDFLVQYVFGGTLSDGTFSNGCFVTLNSDGDALTTSNIGFKLPFIDNAAGYESITINIGDWLSTTATIIIMCLIVFLFVMLVRWVYKTVVSAFLLR